ncbi:MAG: anti-sigma factor [Hyphomicrobiaceae bacterium]|nr:MAG: anti-sigma factor [Hyphomicrobiaceae bacterium]
MSVTDQDKIRCEEVIAHLLQYLDGEIDGEKRAEIDRHLEHCRGCYSRAEFERLLRRKVAALGDEPAPPALQRRLKALMEEF